MAATEGAQRTDDEAILHRLGYAQVLYREMGGFSNFAISFTIISILAGCLTSYYIAFNNGGPVAITWGWLLVGVFCVLVAMAMGEIASAMPTAGALYFWASKLGGPAWGWFTGWFNLVGQIAVTAAIQYGSAIFTTALLNLLFPSLVGTDTGAIFISFTVIVALQLGLNLLNVNLLARLNTISAWWHMAGVAVIVAILILVPDNHQSAGFVFGEVINNSGFSDSAIWFVFGLGLLMSQYTITGYDASAHMSEETRQASRSAAIGMVMAVVASVIFGFILLVAVTFAVPDVPGTLDAAGNAVVYIWTESLGETWAEFLLFIAVIAQLFCGTASVTSASRMLFAFSRDRAVPFSTLWRKVAANRVPVNAVTVISVLSWALMIPTLANGVVGYAVGTSIAVIGLYIAFALPIILRIKAGDSFEHGAWSLGNHYKWISPIAVVWIAVVCVLFLMPISPNGIPGAEEFAWESVNYAPITVFGALILFGGWYLLSARNWFTGPVREAGTEEELMDIEKQLDAEAHRSTGPGAATAAAGAAGTTTAVAVAEKDEVDADKDADSDAPKDVEKDALEDALEDTEKDTATDAGSSDAADDEAAGKAESTETGEAGGTSGDGPADDTADDTPEVTAADTAAAADEAENKTEDNADDKAEDKADTKADDEADDKATDPADAPADDEADDKATDPADAPAGGEAAEKADPAEAAPVAAADTEVIDTEVTDKAADTDVADTPVADTPVADTPDVDAPVADTQVADAPDADDKADTEPTVAAAAATAPAGVVAGEEPEPVSDREADAVEPARAEISPEVRAELKEELKVELKAELLAELRAEVVANGRTGRSGTGTRSRSKSGSSANGKAAAGPEPEPETETPAK